MTRDQLDIARAPFLASEPVRDMEPVEGRSVSSRAFKSSWLRPECSSVAAEEKLHTRIRTLAFKGFGRRRPQILSRKAVLG